MTPVPADLDRGRDQDMDLPYLKHLLIDAGLGIFALVCGATVGLLHVILTVVLVLVAVFRLLNGYEEWLYRRMRRRWRKTGRWMT